MAEYFKVVEAEFPMHLPPFYAKDFELGVHYRLNKHLLRY
jgi:hypothetical protein